MCQQSITATHPATQGVSFLAAHHASHPVYVFDRDHERRQLARLQRIYAARLALLDTLLYAFDEGTPTIIVQGATHTVTVLLGNEGNEVHTALREVVERQLFDLEQQILAAHLRVERGDREQVIYQRPGEFDYVPLLRPLLQPAAGLSREAIAEREAAAHAWADAEAAKENPDNPAAQSRAAHEIGSLRLWHANFPAGFPQQLAHADLYRLKADLPHDVRELNGGRELDAYDYGYLADVLRAALATDLTAAHRLRLERALTWVETTAQP